MEVIRPSFDLSRSDHRRTQEGHGAMTLGVLHILANFELTLAWVKWDNLNLCKTSDFYQRLKVSPFDLSILGGARA